MDDHGNTTLEKFGEVGYLPHYHENQLRDDASLDWMAVLKSSQAISSEIVPEKLLDRLLKTVIQDAGADEAILLLNQDGEMSIQASARADGDIITVLQEASLVTEELLSTVAIDYVCRTGEFLELAHPIRDPRFNNSAYIQNNRPKSLLCIPVLQNGSLVGILYLENHLTAGGFTPGRIKTLQILASQAAISLENARMYAEIHREAQIRRQAEEVLHTITQATAVVTGKDFFSSLLYQLAQAFNVREAFITECDDQSKQQVHTIARIKDGRFQKNFEYDLDGTPCEGVIQGQVCYYPRDVERLFSRGKGKESYLGAPMFDSSGQVLGHLAILDDKPMDLDPQARSVFEIFAARAGAELVRKKSEDALRISERHLRQLNEQLEDYNHNLEQKVAERTHEIDQRRKVAESLSGILTVLNSNRTRDEILSYIVSEATLLLASDTSAIYRFNRRDNLFHLQSVRGDAMNELKKTNFPHELCETIKNGLPVTISVLDTGTSLVSHFLEDLAGNQALLAVPLIVSGETYGCLALYYSQERAFSQEDIAMAVAFGDQASLAIENDRLRNLVKQATILEERSRLARELHDSVTQSIYSLTLLAEGWQRMAKNGELADIVGPLSELGEIAQQALKEIRLLVYELQPVILEQEGLVGALQQRLSAVEKRAGIEARLIAEDLISLPATMEVGLYRIAQEALNNAIKHSGANLVLVRLSARNEIVTLEICDNGRGFEVTKTPAQGGIGLASMRERAEQLGGSLEILSSPGEGTRIVARIHQIEAANRE